MEPNTVIFGEVLFDHFPDEQSVLGGAPFNVAWHLRGFGLSPLLVSCVGRDAGGDQVLSTMDAWGLDTRAVQQHPDYPTGAVQVTLANGQPSFDILADQAYDHIEVDPILATLADDPVELIYMGTLVGRSPRSSATLHTLIERLQASVFVDVNLRSPWWELDRVQQVLDNARWAKLNDIEMNTVLGQELSPQELIPAARSLLERLKLDLLILTLGADGAAFISAKGVEQGAPVPVANLVDTVGAGDAFSSVTLLGLIRDWPLPVTLQRALQFASRICGQRGATAMNRNLYREMLEDWGT
ncbi:MAG: PfkB family carbohydrate kinase [Gammaproteobacteria bacterium]